MVHGPVGEFKSVWVFLGNGARMPSAVFSSQAAAEKWVKANQLSGLLTEYPLDQSAYDWAISQGFFKPSKPEHSAPKFIAGFTSASQSHFHYDPTKGDADQDEP
jgi:hypothetical protein